MVNKRCFIINCSSDYGKENSEVHTFGIPKGKLSLWQERLSHKRGLTEKSRICQRHFNESDFVKGRFIGGVFYEYKMWRLKKDVLPSLHLGNADEFARKPLGNVNCPPALKRKVNRMPSVKSVLKQIVVDDGKKNSDNKLVKDKMPGTLAVSSYSDENVENQTPILNEEFTTEGHVENQMSVDNEEILTDKMPGTLAVSSYSDERVENQTRILNEKFTTEGHVENQMSVDNEEILIDKMPGMLAVSSYSDEHVENETLSVNKEFSTEVLMGNPMPLDNEEVLTDNVPGTLGDSTYCDKHVENQTTKGNNEEFATDVQKQLVNISLAEEMNEYSNLDVSLERVVIPESLNSTSEEQRLMSTDVPQIIDNNPLTESFISRLQRECELPPGWVWLIDLNKKAAFCMFALHYYEQDRMSIKTVQIVSEHQISFYLNGERVHPSGVPCRIENLNSLKSVINEYEQQKVCSGIAGEQSLLAMAKQSKSAETRNNVIKVKNCQGVAKRGDMCMNCGRLKKYLKMRIKSKSPTATRSKIKIQSLKRSNRLLGNLNQKAVDLSKRLKKEKDELALKAKKESLEHYLSTLPLTAQTVVRMFIQKAALSKKDLQGKTMRWDSRYAVQCAMLRMKSCCAFRHIKEQGLLPLPSEETLRKIISSSECDFGLNELALKNIEEELKGLPEEQRFVSLMLDEAKIKPSMEWDRRKMVWRGRVDYGDTELQCDVPDGNATHILVLVVRLYRKSGIQVFATFAVKNGANGTVLSEIIVKCIMALYKCGAIVKNVVGDGASSNKSAYLHLGVSGKLDDGNHFILHPLDSRVKIYFLVDPPHLLKCSKNHLTNHKKVLIAFDEKGELESYVYFDNYEAVYQHEKGMQLKLVPGLTESVMHPNNFERQNVLRSAKFFSGHTGDGISVYSEMEETRHLFKDPYITIQYTYLINDIFDLMNGRCRKEAINRDVVEWTRKRKVFDKFASVLDNTERIYRKLETKRREEEKEKKRKEREKFRQQKGNKGKDKSAVPSENEESDEEDDLFKNQEKEKFQNKKNEPKKKSSKYQMFASQTTMEGWRLTVNSIVSLIEELFDFGYDFVLTGTFNQDPLERVFGQMRHIATHPTCKTALYIMRMIALYSSTGRILIKNANVDQTEQLYNISSYRKCLVDRYKTNTQALEELKLQMEFQLINELSVRFITDCDVKNKDSVDDLLVYDICGYVIKARPFLIDNCKECKKSLVCKELDLPEDFAAANVTILKNKGGLTFVTIPMFLSFRTIESAIAKHFKDAKHVYKSNSYDACIDAICQSNIHPLFCDLHRDHSLPFLIMEYVHIRYYFESKRYKNLYFAKANTQCISDGKKKKSV